MNSTIKYLVILACVLVLQPILSPGSFAHARKRSPPKAFSFIAEGGKASQGECDGERKIPRLKRLKDFNKFGSYMGSELQEPELKGKIEGEMWKHFFRIKSSCNSVLAKTPSAIEEEVKKAPKAELPPDDEVDEEAPHAASEDAETAETAETPDAP